MIWKNSDQVKDSIAKWYTLHKYIYACTICSVLIFVRPYITRNLRYGSAIDIRSNACSVKNRIKNRVWFIRKIDMTEKDSSPAKNWIAFQTTPKIFPLQQINHIILRTSKTSLNATKKRTFLYVPNHYQKEKSLLKKSYLLFLVALSDFFGDGFDIFVVSWMNCKQNVLINWAVYVCHWIVMVYDNNFLISIRW